MSRHRKLVPISPAETKSFEQFYDQYGRLVVFLTKKYTLKTDVVDEVVQETWCRLINQREKLIGLEHGQICSYIGKTVDTVYFDWCRSRHPGVSYHDDTFECCLNKDYDMASDLYLRDQIRRLRTELPPREWFALVGKYYFGYSDEELGRCMGVKSDSVRTLLGRIRRKAKNLLLGGSVIGGGGSER